MCCGSFPFALLASLFVESFKDSFTQTLLQLEEELDSGKVHAKILREVSYPEDSTEIVFGEEADVGLCPRGADQPSLFIDSKRSRMDGHQLRRHADHVDGARGVNASSAAPEHPRILEPYQYHCQVPSEKGGKGSSRLLHVSAVRKVHDHRVAAAEQRVPEALPVAVMEDSIPPVAPCVLWNHHHIDRHLS